MFKINKTQPDRKDEVSQGEGIVKKIYQPVSESSIHWGEGGGQGKERSSRVLIFSWERRRAKLRFYWRVPHPDKRGQCLRRVSFLYEHSATDGWSPP